MSKTIKQIADEIGVSRQAVYQRIKRNPELQERLQPFTVNVDNVVYIDVDGEKILKSVFDTGEHGISGNDNDAVNTPPVNVDSKPVNKTVNVDSHVDSMFAALKMTISTLEKQLDVKDKQIADQAEHIKHLTDTLDQTQQALNAAQALHAGTIQQQLTENEPDIQDDPVANNVTEKKGFFAKIFKKK